MVGAPWPTARGAASGPIPAAGLARSRNKARAATPPHPLRAGGFWRWAALAVGGQARCGDCHAHVRLARSPKSPQPYITAIVNSTTTLAALVLKTRSLSREAGALPADSAILKARRQLRIQSRPVLTGRSQANPPPVRQLSFRSSKAEPSADNRQTAERYRAEGPLPMAG